MTKKHSWISAKLFAKAAVVIATLGCTKPGVDRPPATDSSDAAPASTRAPGDSAFREVQRRGQMAMGVDQYTSGHEFDITADGGRIQLQRKEFDSLDVAQIRAHIRLIQHAFSAGDFTTPALVHSRDMPGARVMAQKKSAITYAYGDVPRGAEVRITTADPEARAAIAQFLTAQRGDHRAHGSGPMKH